MSAQEKSLLIAKLNHPISVEKLADLQSYLSKQVKHLGIEALVVDSSIEPEYHQPISELVEVIKSQTEAINNLVGSNIAILDELVAQVATENEDMSQRKISSLDDIDSKHM
ncbi:hypothetical protein [Vibrio metschnikovii]|uniref:hypothetical protein n=1 Tax=Vibrio metschnikovii TaxID=28172 RepID=UPI001302A232|nr:hypothetical protein [Vibrio metschnikovii]